MSELLSICIPTYNREKYLKRALESICAVIDILDIKVYVQDNASEDDTEYMMEKYISDKIIYERNKENIGAVKNINLLFDKAEGEYLFFLTDDDCFLPGGIDKLLEFIKEYSPDFVSSDLITYLEKSHQVFLYSATERNGIVSDANNVAEIFMHSNILTRCCFKKSALSNWRIDMREKNVYPHMVALMDLIIGRKKISYIAEPIVLHTWENETYWELDFGKNSKTSADELEAECAVDERNIIHAAEKLLDKQILDALCEKMVYAGMMNIDEAPLNLRGKIKQNIRKRKYRKIIRYIGKKILG